MIKKESRFWLFFLVNITAYLIWAMTNTIERSSLQLFPFENDHTAFSSKGKWLCFVHFTNMTLRRDYLLWENEINQNALCSRV